MTDPPRPSIPFGYERLSGRTALSGRVEVEGVEVSTEHWIGGERVASGSTFTDISPIDEEPIAEVARGGVEEAERAVDAAKKGFETWGSMAPEAARRDPPPGR